MDLSETRNAHAGPVYPVLVADIVDTCTGSNATHARTGSVVAHPRKPCVKYFVLVQVKSGWVVDGNEL